MNILPANASPAARLFCSVVTPSVPVCESVCIYAHTHVCICAQVCVQSFLFDAIFHHLHAGCCFPPLLLNRSCINKNKLIVNSVEKLTLVLKKVTKKSFLFFTFVRKILKIQILICLICNAYETYETGCFESKDETHKCSDISTSFFLRLSVEGGFHTYSHFCS